MSEAVDDVTVSWELKKLGDGTSELRRYRTSLTRFYPGEFIFIGTGHTPTLAEIVDYAAPEQREATLAFLWDLFTRDPVSDG